VHRAYNQNGGTLYGEGGPTTNNSQQEKGRKTQGKVGRWSER